MYLPDMDVLMPRCQEGNERPKGKINNLINRGSLIIYYYYKAELFRNSILFKYI